MPPTPRIFISYSHDSAEHRAFVLACSNRLRADGLDCHIDQYVNGFPPEGWQRWMENQIEQADFVLMVCTPVYLQRYRGLDEDGGRGVTFEGVVISQHLYDAYYRNTKFVPVIPEAGDYEHVPVPLRAYNTYTLPVQYDGLYRYLSGQPEHIAPEIGNRRVMPTAQVASLSAEPSEVTPDWAQHSGRDEFGRFAEIAVGDVLQRMRWIETAEGGFWMADTACTQALWLTVMGSNPAEFTGDLQRPVERVSWSAVQGFLRQLNQRVSGLLARLPTEAEWEFAAGAMTIDDKKWGVPYTYYQWGVYYRKDLFEKHDIEVPKNWEEFLAASAKLKENDITPITIGTKYLWTAAGVFDYLNLRTNGYAVHNDLTAGKIKYTDDRIKKTFDHWDQLVKPGYFIENHAAMSWQEALAPMVQGKAAMYVMGNFAVAPLREAGLTDDQLGFFQFPMINPDVEMAEEAPTDTFHIPAKAKNKEDARTFLKFLATKETQGMVNEILGQLPIHKDAKIKDDKFIKAGFEMLSNASDLAQFYDRDAPAEMAKAGMEGFQEYMVKPDRREKILERLDKVQEKVYK